MKMFALYGIRGIVLKMLDYYLKNWLSFCKIVKIEFAEKELIVESRKDQYLVNYFSLST